MSQTFFRVDKFVITAGWDRPFNHYFANIDADDDKEDKPFYTTMDDNEADIAGGFKTLEEVKVRVESRVGVLPEGFWTQAAIKDMNERRYVRE